MVIDIRRQLVNIPSYTKDGVVFTIDAVSRGFNRYRITESGVNELELAIELEWKLDGVVYKKSESNYSLHNDIWFDGTGKIVPRYIKDEDGNDILNPQAQINECDYWLAQMAYTPVQDIALITDGFEYLDMVQKYWLDIEL